MEILYDVINWFFEQLGVILEGIFSILPDSPFLKMSAETPDLVEMGYITWLIPFPTMILHTGLFLVAVGVYYGFRIVARWLKLVRG
ncbi:hypothetical protein [Bacillus sp. B1-b2]|uniref:hypothetical protein n=1 Tax=Bacillus sp. B1-b2 TaxID=2653201 RepID=UPI0012615051|nr:hypothetical protein [Bacillus sp. B1-b2]KAB7663026.1 hypothetical protein F9279_24335 [Bacillus sp. B1-b2]